MASGSERLFWGRLNLGLVIMLGLVLLIGWQRPDDKLRIVMCDVGQGDATLISFKSYQLLVDGGPDNSVLNCLGKNMGFWDRKIEVVVMTHPQADHMTGLIEVVERYEVGKLIVANVINDIPEFWRLRQVVEEKQVEVRELVKGDRLRLGAVEVKVLWPKERGGEPLAWEGGDEDRQVLGMRSYQGDVNQMSLVLLGSFGKFDFLLTGDIGEKEERELVAELEPVELLKIAHHGSRYSSSQGFIEKVRPEIGMISVSKKNRFGHPTQAVLDRLTEVGAKIMRTDKDGMVRIVVEGRGDYRVEVD